MKPGTVNPYPKRGYRMRTDAEFIARTPRPAVHAAVTRVLTDLYPKRRSAGMLAVLIFLTTQSLYSTNGVWVGHAELSKRFGVSRRTLVDRLGEWRNGHRLLDRKLRGRKNSHVTWWAAPNALVKAIAAELRKTSKRRSVRKPKLVNASQPQCADSPQEAAPGSRTAGGGLREDGRVESGKRELLPKPDKPDKPVGLGGSAIWAAKRAELEAAKLAAKIARARGLTHA